MEININNIDMAAYEKIKQSITSKDSVVGIDAVHTHILIIHKLMQIEQQLQQLQQRLEGIDK
ncbi:MAG: hypothetical protein K2W79_02375 [Hydrotalea flava]|uniref:hypothetical protein n=1 Tax=Hydrotalea TaxID=1004300 RepID=UPI000944EC9D|nr:MULTISPECIES: hypothetical protein [Hydrotalea]MBY0347078.1 hypothetical protein [Hydrotalea flava]RWZ87395.1 MAG: hypothetical protein EO766_11095 [Hydrotalea sp. AMD]